MKRARPAILWSLWPWRLPEGGLAGLPPHRAVLGRLTFLYRHLVNVRSGPVFQLEHLPFKQLLPWGGEVETWARLAKVYHMLACFGRCLLGSQRSRLWPKHG